MKLDVTYVDGTENDPKQRKPVIDKAKERLGWEPFVSLKWGLLETLNHFGLALKQEEELEK